MEVASGALRAFFLFDLADTIDLSALRSVGGEGFERADLPLRPHTSPAYLQFPIPPLVARLPDAELEGRTFQRRIKIFDYGVISVRVSQPFAGPWDEFVRASAAFRTDARLLALARSTIAEVSAEIRDRFDEPHDPLVEDYFVTEVQSFAQPVAAETLLSERRSDIAGILQGETGTFAERQIEESLRQQFSYYVDDLSVVQWDAAFVYDRADSAEAIEDILEFANSQLVELRTYDERLDRELDAIYAGTARSVFRSLLGRRAAERAAVLRYLIVDVLELIDRSSNALKIIGDAHFARIYRAAAQRLGLETWQNQVNSKLASVGDFYRFFSDEARSGRDLFLEAIVILLIAIEVAIGLLTFHR